MDEVGGGAGGETPSARRGGGAAQGFEGPRRASRAARAQAGGEARGCRGGAGGGVVAFKAGDHAQAVVRFEAGVALFTPMPADFLAEGADFNASDVQLGCLLNIAACQLRLEQPLKAIAACDLATALDEKSVKAWFRRGQACLALGQVDAARKDLTRACQLAPSSREIRDELDKCKRVGAPKFI